MPYASTKEIEALASNNAKSELLRKLTNASEDALNEAFEAASKWAPMNSAHEAFGVYAEELDELSEEVFFAPILLSSRRLWDHVKVNQKRRGLGKMRTEAVQCAAMLLRFITDICDSDRGRV